MCGGVPMCQIVRLDCQMQNELPCVAVLHCGSVLYCTRYMCAAVSVVLCKCSNVCYCTIVPLCAIVLYCARCNRFSFLSEPPLSLFLTQFCFCNIFQCLFSHNFPRLKLIFQNIFNKYMNRHFTTIARL